MKKMILLLVFCLCTLSPALATRRAELPTYQFQSTSTCSSVVGSSAFMTTTVYTPYSGAPTCSPRRAKSWEPDDWGDGDDWGDPGDDDFPTGVIPNPTPIGEPLILFLFAMLYVLIRLPRRLIEIYKR